MLDLYTLWMAALLKYERTGEEKYHKLYMFTWTVWFHYYPYGKLEGHLDELPPETRAEIQRTAQEFGYLI